MLSAPPGWSFMKGVPSYTCGRRRTIFGQSTQSISLNITFGRYLLRSARHSTPELVVAPAGACACVSLTLAFLTLACVFDARLCVRRCFSCRTLPSRTNQAESLDACRSTSAIVILRPVVTAFGGPFLSYASKMQRVFTSRSPPRHDRRRASRAAVPPARYSRVMCT